MKDLRRALNRHHAKRIKNKRVTQHYWGMGRQFFSEVSPRLVGIAARSPKPCGCWMCGNARKVFGRPLSELRLLQDGLSI